MYGQQQEEIHPCVIPGEDRFSLVILTATGNAILVEQRDERPLWEDDDIRVHPVELHLGSDIIQKGVPGKIRLAAQYIHNRLSLVISPQSQHDPFVALEGPDNPKLAKFDASLREKVMKALCREVTQWGQIAQAVREQNIGPVAQWPAALCRDMVENDGRAEKLNALFKEISIFLEHDRGLSGTCSFLIHLSGAGQDGSSANMSLLVSTLTPKVDPEVYHLADALFQTAVKELWPDGWSKTFGPGSTRGYRSADPYIKKMFRAANAKSSNHEVLAALAKWRSHAAEFRKA